MAKSENEREMRDIKHSFPRLSLQICDSYAKGVAFSSTLLISSA